jgi:hypothetical protein
MTAQAGAGSALTPSPSLQNAPRWVCDVRISCPQTPTSARTVCLWWRTMDAGARRGHLATVVVVR